MKKNNQDSSSFISGLVVGLFSGAVASFLSHTEPGQKLKSNLSEHWKEVRKKLISEEVIDQATPEDAMDLLDYAFKQMAIELRHHWLRDKKSTTKKKRDTKPTKFIGT